jgi:peptidylprolyl isomerase domain and WD repeat-containing protein 1
MHKEIVSHVLVSHVNEFIFTASIDGYVKFWKKASEGIEFVKTYRAHLSKITGFALSQNEERLASVSALDMTYKVFDVANFDLMHMTKLTFVPSICCFVEKRVMSFTPLLCICEENAATMRIFKAEGSSG